MNENFDLEHYFDLARQDESQIEFERTKKAFLGSIIVAAGGVLATKSVLKVLMVKKWIVMTSILSIVTTGAVIGTMTLSSGTTGGSNNELALASFEEEKTEFDSGNYSEDLDPEITDTFEAIPLELVEEIEEEPIEINETEVNETAPVMNTEDIFASTDNHFIILGSCRAVPLPRIVFDNEPKKVEFEITENTTEAEMEEIQRLARNAGIDFNYTIKWKESKIKKLELEMALDTKDSNESKNINISTDGDDDSFTYSFGWYEDSKGKVTSFTDDETEVMGSFEDSMEELGERMEALGEELEMAFDFERLDSLSEVYAIEMEGSMDSLDAEIALLEEKINAMTEDFDFENFDILIEEISTATTKFVEAVMEDFEEMEIEEEDK